MSTPNTPTEGSRLDRLRHTINSLEHQARLDEQAAEAGYINPARNPHDATRDDLRALIELLNCAARDLSHAANVPEWDNWKEEDGTLYGLGSVAHNYADWVREGDEPASEHDGATQLADLADALTDTINALDALAYDRNGESI